MSDNMIRTIAWGVIIFLGVWLYVATGGFDHPPMKKLKPESGCITHKNCSEDQ